MAPILYWKGKILGKASFLGVRISLFRKILLNFIGWCFVEGILSIVNSYVFCFLYLSTENISVLLMNAKESVDFFLWSKIECKLEINSLENSHYIKYIQIRGAN